MRQQDRLDLTRLDAVTANLDLLIGAADELHRAIFAPARQVAGAIKAGVRVTGIVRAGERVGHEALACDVGPVQVAACQAATADVQLAGPARWHQRPVGTQDA